MQKLVFHYGERVQYQGHVWRVWSECESEKDGIWQHNLISSVPTGNCTDGTGLVHIIAKDTDLVKAA